MAKSMQKKISMVRKPRVHLTYDVETLGAIEQKELPFVVGVMSDLSGKPDPSKPLPKLKDRKFVQIDRDNFDDVLKGIKPRLAYQVDDKLETDGEEKQMSVEIEFESMEDFHPEQVVEKVPRLKALIEKRRHLADILARMDGNDKLAELLDVIIDSEEHKSNLQKQLEGALKDSGGEDKE